MNYLTLIILVNFTIVSSRYCAWDRHCGQNAKCSWLQCKCDTGYFSNEYEDCISSDKCKKIKCAINAGCVIKDNKLQCHCFNGYVGDGYKICTPLLQCKNKVCVTNAECISNLYCQCSKGFVGDGEIYCTPSCLIPCDPVKEQCILLDGIRSCQCKPGYPSITGDTKNGSYTCSDQNYCISNPCTNKELCTPLAGGYKCECDEYLENKCENSIFFNETLTEYNQVTLYNFYDEYSIIFEKSVNKIGLVLAFQNEIYDDFMSVSYEKLESINLKIITDNNTFIKSFDDSEAYKYWDHIELRQYFNTTFYITTIFLNETAVFSGINDNPKLFTGLNQISVLPDNSGLIKSLKIVTKTQVFWSEWSEWSDCNISCKTIRNRTCNNNNQWVYCEGNSIDIDLCDNLQVYWNQWNDWSICYNTHVNESEKSGFMNRSRECKLLNSKECCNGSNFEVEICFAYWAEWSNWSYCNNSYGVGFMNRTRECKVSNNKMLCLGNNFETISCCSSDALRDSWNQWNDWSTCNNTYVDDAVIHGFMNRSRDCKFLNGEECCNGSNSQIKTCYAYWAEWNNWSNCNISYGIGYMNRTRKCNVSNNKMMCPGNNSEIITCCFSNALKGNAIDSKKCCVNNTYIVSWNQWNDWSTCNAKYTIGFTNRSRECNLINAKECCNGTSLEIDKCYVWSTWSECSSTCGEGNKTRSALQVVTSPVIKSCNVISCPLDGNWGEWSQPLLSPAKCGAETCKFNRSCNNPSPKYYGRDCLGVSNYSKECGNNKICPINGIWSSWSEWSLCSQPCEDGVISKFRGCSKQVPKYGGFDCIGNSTETKECYWNICKAVVLRLYVFFPDVEYLDDFNSDLNSLPSYYLKTYIKNSISTLYKNFTRNVSFDINFISLSKNP